MSLASCNYLGIKTDDKEIKKTKKEPLFTFRTYNYNTNERVHLKVRGLENCKLDVDMEKLMFSTKFKLPNKYIKEKEKEDKKD